MSRKILAWYTLLVDDLEFTTPCWSATSSLLHLVGLRPRVYYTLINFRGGGQGPLAPPPQYANAS